MGFRKTHLVILLVGLGFALFLGGCNATTSSPASNSPAKVPSVSYVKEGEYGACEYKNGFKGDEQFTIHFNCKPKEKEAQLLLSCSNYGTWAILTSAGSSVVASKKPDIEYQFDDNALVKETWNRTPVSSVATWANRLPNAEFLEGMKTKKELTYTLYGKTAHLDLAGVAEGVRKFEKNCKTLVETTSNSGPAIFDADLVNKYLTEANAGLPRNTFPFFVESVSLRDKDLITKIIVDATKMDAEEARKANQSIKAATITEVATICLSPYHKRLSDQGYNFRVHLTGINSRGTKHKEIALPPAACRDFNGYVTE